MASIGILETLYPDAQRPVPALHYQHEHLFQPELTCGDCVTVLPTGIVCPVPVERCTHIYLGRTDDGELILQRFWFDC